MHKAFVSSVAALASSLVMVMLMVMVMFIAGCGQKGPLYLPAPAAPASAGGR